jgi:polar amino acid transport system substrate-binding protein
MRLRVAWVAAALCLASLTAVASASAGSPSPAGPGTPAAFVVALSLGDPAMQAGVVKGSEIVLARGFEVALSRALVRRLGGRVGRFVEIRPAARLLAGAPAGWHLALASIEPSRGARAAADLSTPYLTTDVAVVLRRGLTRPAGIADLRGHALCAARGSDAVHVLRTTVRPRTAPRIVTGDDRLRTLLRTGACDAALVPAVDAGRFVRGHAGELGAITGRIDNGEGLVVGVARGSGLDVTAVDRALGRLRADGTLDRLARSWLGLDPARLRVLR